MAKTKFVLTPKGRAAFYQTIRDKSHPSRVPTSGITDLEFSLLATVLRFEPRGITQRQLLDRTAGGYLEEEVGEDYYEYVDDMIDAGLLQPVIPQIGQRAEERIERISSPEEMKKE